MTEDYTKQLREYLKRNLAKGYNLEALRIALIKQNYSKILVAKAIEKVNEELAKSVPLFKEKPKIKHEIIDEYDNPVTIKKSFFRIIFRRQ